jgi:hypothetical protein
MNYRYSNYGWPNAGAGLRGSGYSRGGCPAYNSPGDCAWLNSGCGAGTKCIAKGNRSLKSTCPTFVYDQPSGKSWYISDGKCDCDLDDWSKPSSPTSNQVSLAFQSSGYAGTNRTLANLQDGSAQGENGVDEELAGYLHGVHSQIDAVY